MEMYRRVCCVKRGSGWISVERPCYVQEGGLCSAADETMRSAMAVTTSFRPLECVALFLTVK